MPDNKVPRASRLQMNRYSRQELFPGIGKEGQSKLRAANVTIVGCGALGSLQAEVLCRAGIGSIHIIDRDFVEHSNLQRQALFTEEDAKNLVPKAVAARNQLQRINQDVLVKTDVSDLSPDNIDLLSGANLILDGTDNFSTRYLINDFAWKNQIPWIYGACVSSSGVACAFIPDSFPCLRCLFENEPPPGTAPTCDTAGIIWPAVGTVVGYQIAAAFKILTGAEQLPEILQLDVWDNEYRTVSLEKAKRSNCATCGLREFPSLAQSSGFDTSLCGRDAVQIKPAQKAHLDLQEIHDRWSRTGECIMNPFLVKLVLPENEIVLFPDGRAIIKGTVDIARARDLYAKYVGS
ncbi:ThiF family adenylyltransferase [bacterium]|nr:ThiF family adenylyltransferase [bacterium]